MSIIDFKSTKCKHCYKCVRNCLVNAVQIRNERAEIMEDHCILCGRCLNVCPQKAKTLSSELDDVREMIRSGERVVATIAPSYLALLKFEKPGQVKAALMKLGFEDVRETSEGAAFVTSEYERLVQEGTMENIITTCCPSVNDLIEMYYPQLLPYLAPVVSPMVASGMLIRKEMGENVKVVFIGPCIAKKKEAQDIRNKGVISHVLNFNDIDQWLTEENIRIEQCEDLPYNKFDPKVNRLYPVSNGIVNSVVSTERGKKDAYRKFYEHGEQNCIDLCESMVKGELSHCFIEMNICEGGCIKGPSLKEGVLSRFKAKVEMEDTITREPVPAEIIEKAGKGLSFGKAFSDRSPHDPVPTEEEIQAILRKTDKTSPEDELNCGACGYSTCREKAVAVFQHKAELTMCIPYIQSRAESMSNVVLDTSPNGVILVDKDMKIIEFSQASEQLFRKTRSEALKMYLVELIDPTNALYVLDSHAGIHGCKVEYPEYKLCTMQNIVYIAKQNAVLITITDITNQENERKSEYEKAIATAEMAQNVINKQMTVAQEIAGLLGETTAETKMILTKMCRSILEENSGTGKQAARNPSDLYERSAADRENTVTVDTTYNDNTKENPS